MSNPLVTFEGARRRHLLDGMSWTTEQTLDWLESSDEFAAMCRKLRFEKGLPVSDAHGRKFWSEEEYLGVPEWARTGKR